MKRNGYGQIPAPRSCPDCQTTWTLMVDRPERADRRTVRCDECRQARWELLAKKAEQREQAPRVQTVRSPEEFIPWAPTPGVPAWSDSRLQAAALELIADVRDRAPEDIAPALAEMPALTAAHLLIALAAMVPDDRTLTQLLAWAEPIPSVLRRGAA